MVWERVWSNREEAKGLVEVPLRSGELYGREVVVDYPFDYDPEEGFVELPKVFSMLRPHPDPQRVRLRYQFPSSVTGKGVVEGDQITGKRTTVMVWYLADSAVAQDEASFAEEGDAEGEEGGGGA